MRAAAAGRKALQITVEAGRLIPRLSGNSPARVPTVFPRAVRAAEDGRGTTVRLAGEQTRSHALMGGPAAPTPRRSAKPRPAAGGLAEAAPRWSEHVLGSTKGNGVAMPSTGSSVNQLLGVAVGFNAAEDACLKRVRG